MNLLLTPDSTAPRPISRASHSVHLGPDAAPNETEHIIEQAKNPLLLSFDLPRPFPSIIRPSSRFPWPLQIHLTQIYPLGLSIFRFPLSQPSTCTMGIDPDAYMSGAIPSLNRGGSWRMDDPHALGSQYQSNQSPGSGQGSGASIFPRPSQIVPPHPTLTLPNVNGNGGMNLNMNMGNRGNFLPFHAQSKAMSTGGHGHPHPYMSPSMGSPTIRPDVGMGSQSGGSRKAGSVRPTLVLAAGTGGRSQGGGSMVSSRLQSVRSANHPGWASLGAASVMGNGHKSSPNSPTTPSSAGFIAGQATSQYGLKPSIKVKPLISPRVVEPEWDWESASPSSPRSTTPRGSSRVMTSEPDYFSIQHSQSTMTAPNTPTSGMGPGFVSLPPPPRAALPQSPGFRAETHSHSHQSQIPNPYRPVATRRHTHDRFSPESEPVLERSGRAMKLDSRSLGRARVRSGLRKPTFDSDIGSEAGESYYAPSTKTYAHTLDTDDRSSSRHSSATSMATTAPASRMEKMRPGNPRRSTSSVLPSSPLAKGRSHPSFTEKRFKNRSHPALSTITSTVDFTQTAPSSATTNKHPRQAHSMDMRALNEALPPVPQTAPLHGYIPPDSEHGYDPYEAHPAPAPAPTTSTPTASLDKSKAPTKPPGAGLKHVTPDSYRPPGFPKPVKELAWNREGPAMKTHGVAWLREAEPDALPCGPAGPRYIQARPPAVAVQNGGSWWDSAA